MDTHKLPGPGGSDSGSANKPEGNDILQTFNAVETTPATEQAVKGVQEQMRKRMNAVLEEHGEKSTGGIDGMHHPAGQKEVNIRAGLEFKKFKETVKGLLNHQVETVQGSTRGKIYQVLGELLPQLKAAATEPVKKDETKKVDEKPDVTTSKSTVYQPTTWYGKSAHASLIRFPRFVGKTVVFTLPRIVGEWAKQNLSLNNVDVFNEDYALNPFSKKK